MRSLTVPKEKFRRREGRLRDANCWHCSRCLFYSKEKKLFIWYEVKIQGYLRRLHRACLQGYAVDSAGHFVTVDDLEDLPEER